VDDSLSSAIGELWMALRPRELQRVEVIEQAIVAVNAGTLDDSARRHAHEEAHRLAGSLAALGTGTGCASARTLEARFLRFPPQEEAAELAEHARTLRTAVERVGTQPPLGSAP
jgi:HPt (histidine-containing phosphotransfer) domain-containing protein